MWQTRSLSYRIFCSIIIIIILVLPVYHGLNANQIEEAGLDHNGNVLDSLSHQLKLEKNNENKIQLLNDILKIKMINNKNSDSEVKMLEEIIFRRPYDILSAKSDYLIGNIQKINGEGNKALKHYTRSLDYYMSINDKNEMARLNMAIGEDLRAFGEQVKALSYLRKAEKLFKEEALGAEIYDRFAAVYFEMIYISTSVYADSSRIYAKKAISLAQKNNDFALLISSYNILGAVERSQKNFQKSQEYLFKAKDIAEKNKRYADLSLVYSNIARLYEERNNRSSCIYYAKKAYDLAIQTDIKIYIAMSSLILFDNYKKLRNFKDALKYYEIHHLYSQKIYDENKDRKIALYIANRELEIKKNENNLLVKQQKLQETVIKKQKQNQIYLMSVIGMIALLSLIIIYYIRQLKKANIQLKEEHAKVLNLERIRSAYAMAVTANHELNQPLMVLKGRLELLQMSMDESNEAQMKQMQKIEKVFDEVMDVLEKYRKSDRNIHFELYAGDEEMVVFDEEE
ncbi:MAG TPA: tetratricopeptide repeat protein [Candidatus Cloacimonadota bacterium]|nr:tetratricopeptide repeat protein [Candidatus Cloacimonadota bacterium]